MSIVGVIAGAETAIEAGKKVIDGTQKVVAAGRKEIAKNELETEKDLDGDGIIGGVGNKRVQRAPDCEARTNGR